MPFPSESARAAMQSYGSRVSAIGTYAPSRVLTNADLSKMVDTNDEWIVRRTGIRERRVSADDEFTSDLCTAAACDLLARHDVDRDAIGMVIACTTTPDFAVPSVACVVQDRLGLRNAGAMDLNATCAGFVYGLQIASAMTATGAHRSVLVVAGETLTKVTDYTDRTTCILFGDAAGAGLVEQSDRRTVLAASMGSEGSGGPLLYRTGLSERIGDGQHLGYLRQNGREVYKWAVETVSACVCDLLRRAGLTAQDLSWFAPHSANLRITEAVCERTGIPMERTLSSIEYYGNTSAATIPLALAGALADGRLREGDTVLMYGFGGGLVHAGLLVEWHGDTGSPSPSK
jgi:3-oxoacyl-[acyl-carrier-protein] synthase III